MKCKHCGRGNDFSIIVGTKNRKEVSKLNNELFLKAKEIMMADENQGLNHIGLIGISAFIDWLEEYYKLEEK